MDGDTGLGFSVVLVGGAVALVVVVVTSLLGIALVGNMVAGISDQVPPENRTANPNPETGTAVPFEDTTGKNEITEVYRVRDSTGRAVRLTGDPDSFYQSNRDIAPTRPTQSVSTWAAVDSAATGETMTILDVDGRLLLQYDGSASEYVAWVYNDSSRNSYRLTGAAPRPTDLTLLTLTTNSSHLRLYRNETAVATVDRSSSTASQLNATNFDGRVDETRVFDDYTTASEQQTLYDQPVGPVPSRDRLARITFDEGAGDSSALYFAGGSVSLSGYRWSNAGLAGNLLVAGQDYTLDAAAGTITALAGGRIDGAPVVWIDYEFAARDRVGRFGGTLAAVFEFLGSATIAVPAVAVLVTLLTGLGLGLRGIDVSLPGDNEGGR